MHGLKVPSKILQCGWMALVNIVYINYSKKKNMFSPVKMSGCVLSQKDEITHLFSLIKGALGKPGGKLYEVFNLFNVLDSKIKSQCHSFCFSILVLHCWYKWKTREQLCSWHPQNYKWGLLSETPSWKMTENNLAGERIQLKERKQSTIIF